MRQTMNTFKLLAASLMVAVLVLSAVACGGSAKEAEHGDEGHGEGEHGEGEHGEGEHGEGEHGGEVHLDAHVIERNGIVTEAAQMRLLLGALEVPAEVKVNPDRIAHVASLAPGRLSEINAKLGDRVERGDVLAVVRSVELGKIRADLSVARARERAARADLERLQVLADEGLAAKRRLTEARARSETATAEVKAAKAGLLVYGGSGRGGAELSLRAPISGTIIKRHASPGEVIDTLRSPFVIADLSEVWVMGRVYEQELSQVSEGMAADVALIAYPGRTWRGAVDYVSSTLDEDTRTVSIRVVLDNDEGLLRPGLFGTIAIGPSGESEGSGEVLSIPDTALSTVGDRTVVFVTGDEEGSFVPRDVVPGQRAHGLVEIREGLKVGEPVVTGGAFVLKSELLKGSIGEGHAH